MHSGFPAESFRQRCSSREVGGILFDCRISGAKGSGCRRENSYGCCRFLVWWLCGNRKDRSCGGIFFGADVASEWCGGCGDAVRVSTKRWSRRGGLTRGPNAGSWSESADSLMSFD